jgi:hypothetical protein
MSARVAAACGIVASSEVVVAAVAVPTVPVVRNCSSAGRSSMSPWAGQQTPSSATAVMTIV